ncbi:MAG TPA: M3 family metallopeptidase [Casimicrobiaceae bacterium]|jgi:peptidyl-dipeptidase Dcp|nr:M3 family metallopeptidase [Casimicrobiaceae bacterium]
MRRRSFLHSTALVALAQVAGTAMTPAALAAAAKQPGNPLLDEWTGPHGGSPRFDMVNVDAFKPAIMRGMDLKRIEVAAIAGNSAAPDFENTLAALDDSGRPFGRATQIFRIYVSTMNDKRMQAVETEMAPLLSAFSDEIIQNEALFARLKTVYDARANASLSPEQQRLADVVYTNFARRGAALGKAEKAHLKEINKRLASLFTTFRQNQLADEESYTLVIDNEADLAGLPDNLRDAAANAAEAKGRKGKWLFTNTRSSMEPFITYASRRDLREKGWRMWIMRGDNPGAHDNKPVIAEILQLRAERAQLLGFASHAHWILDDNMAKTPDAAMALMMKVWKAAVARAREEIADMQAIADSEGAGIKIEPWDYRYYAEKVRKSKYDLDQTEISQYLQLDKIREAMFWVADQLYGLQFVKVDDVPVYHPEMSVYEVRRNGKRVGLWYLDPYARAGKNSGAWMNQYRTQEKFRTEITPVVSNNANFVKGKPGKPVLISWDDAVTMFHEFGHGLHGLNSNVTYPTLAGTSVKRDFVEFPSQLNEHWLPTPEVLKRFALHHQTGKPIPAEFVAKIERAKNFDQGFSTVEYLAAAIYDMKIHLAATPDQKIDAVAFEKQTMAEIGCPSEIVMRHRPTQFGHIFSSDGYSAGYYVYIWADTLTDDTFEAFREAGGPYDKSVAKRYYDTVLSVGNSVPPDEAFRHFRGRDVDTDALMRERGFPVTKF